MRFSVVIPTYNEGDSLQLCLDALRKQTFQGSYQVIVVDNGSTVNIPEVDAADPLVKLVKEPTPGSYSARNTGIRHAEGEIIAFTDSDCIPDAGWLESADRVLAQDKDVALLAGRVRIFYEDARNPTAVELFENQYSFKQDENVKQGWAVTANVFVRRAVIDDIGVFNTATFSGGDSEFTRRAVEAGYQLAYSHDAAVQHPARRTTVSYTHLTLPTKRIV